MAASATLLAAAPSYSREGEDRLLPHERHALLDGRHERDEIGRHLGPVLGRNPGGQQGARDAGRRDVSPRRDVGHGDLFAAALCHEVGRHTVERPHPIRLDHLLDGGAAFGQVREDSEPLLCRGVIGVVEPGVTPDVLRIHPIRRSR
jgi:hypothetical protein